MSSLAAVLKTARLYADKKYKEGKNNDNIFGKHYGINNIPWCAEFVSYCFDINGFGKLVAAQSKKGFISCSAGVAWFKKNKRLVKVNKAQPGDIAFMNFHGSKTAADHVEIVLRNDTKSKVLYCIGGNTVNPDGSGDQANGDGVYYKTRPYRYITYVANPNWPVEQATDSAVKTEIASTGVNEASKKLSAPAEKPQDASEKTYTVKAGDSYWAIAQAHPVEGKAVADCVKKLQELNNNKPLHPGDKIKLY